MISAHHLTKTVHSHEGQLHILQDINLEIADGESIAIVGASGSGKTTLLSLLAGLDLPSSGSVSLNGQEITGLDEDGRAAVRAESVGFVFQSFQLLPSLTALENVMLPAELKGDTQAQAHAEEFLSKVGLAERTSHYPRQLSGGEQQRVAIARAFASNAPILFADEPTGNLDSRTGAKVIDLLFSLNEDLGRTLVLVTHEQRLADRCARRIELDSGRMISDQSGAQ